MWFSRLHRGLKQSDDINSVIPLLMYDPHSKNRHKFSGDRKTGLTIIEGFSLCVTLVTHCLYLHASRVEAAMFFVKMCTHNKRGKKLESR